MDGEAKFAIAKWWIHGGNAAPEAKTQGSNILGTPRTPRADKGDRGISGTSLFPGRALSKGGGRGVSDLLIMGIFRCQERNRSWKRGGRLRKGEPKVISGPWQPPGSDDRLRGNWHSLGQPLNYPQLIGQLGHESRMLRTTPGSYIPEESRVLDSHRNSILVLSHSPILYLQRSLTFKLVQNTFPPPHWLTPPRLLSGQSPYIRKGVVNSLENKSKVSVNRITLPYAGLALQHNLRSGCIPSIH